MEYRQLDASGLMVPALSLGTGTFGGGSELLKAWGASDVAEARRLVDICLQIQLAVDKGPQVPPEHLYRVVDVLDEVSKETGKTIPQIAKLDAASAVPLTYPYWHQRLTFAERNPPAV